MKKPLLFGMLLTVCVVIVTFVFAQFYPGGMISYWKFEEGSGPTALDSVGANDGTIYGATRTTGQVGGALSFDGIDDYVDCGNVLNVTNKLTIEAWVKDSGESDGNVVGKFEAYDKRWHIYIDSIPLHGGKLIYWNIGGRTFATSLTSAIGTDWHHLAMVYDGTQSGNEGRLKAYIDGAPIMLSYSGTIPATMPAISANVNIGRHDTVNFFKGLIDEAAIYGRALSAGEIEQHFQNGLNGSGYEVECVTPPTDMVSWWPGDGDADDIVDGNHGTLENGATFATGIVGQAFSFDGGNDYVSIGNMGSFPSVGTIDFWMKADVVQNYKNPFTTKYQGRNAGIRFEEHSFSTGYTNSFNVVIGDDGGNYCNHWFRYTATEPPDNNPMLANTWYHVALVWDSTANNVKGYWDGELAFDEDHSCWPTTLPNVAIGNGYSSTRYWDGLIDEVEIFNRALDAAEIQAIYLAGSAGKCKGEVVIEVDIDIKPGSDPNCFNIDGHGNIPVAILGSLDFDVLDIDVNTLSFEGMVVRVRGKGRPMCSFEDSNSDLFLDLVCHFEDDPTTWNGGNSTATVTGNLLDGTEFEGTDSICIVKIVE